jgi:hypothetical protein
MQPGQTISRLKTMKGVTERSGDALHEERMKA